MYVHARLRPKFAATVGALEAQGYRQLFPATRNPSVRTSTHAVMIGVPMDAANWGQSNTNKKIRTSQCIWRVVSVARIYTRHHDGRLQVEGLNEKKGPNVRKACHAWCETKVDLLKIEKWVNRRMHSIIKRNGSSCSVRKIHNSHNETAKDLMR